MKTYYQIEFQMWDIKTNTRYIHPTTRIWEDETKAMDYAMERIIKAKEENKKVAGFEIRMLVTSDN